MDTFFLDIDHFLVWVIVYCLPLCVVNLKWFTPICPDELCISFCTVIQAFLFQFVIQYWHPYHAFIRGLLKMFFCHTHDLIGSAILPIKQKSDTLVDAAIEISRFLFLPHADVPSSSEPLGFFASVLWLIRKQTKRNGGLRVVASGCNSNTTLK